MMDEKELRAGLECGAVTEQQRSGLPGAASPYVSWTRVPCRTTECCSYMGSTHPRLCDEAALRSVAP